MTKLLRYINPSRRQPGFTLTEMAIVLVIVALMIGGMLVPLSAQRELQNTKETQRMLSEIKESLLGFAAAYGRLPCPDTDTDPTAAGYGQEEASCSTDQVAEGYLPWKTLGANQVDAWGSKRTSSTDPRIGDWRYRVDRNFAQAFTLTTPFSGDSLTVKDSFGNNLTSTVERPVAIVFSAGPNLVPDGENSSFEPTSGIYQSGDFSPIFDDIVIWIGRPILFNRMISAGRLP
jgi:prepilin-type N-terminal cleavage/methylation domain-containing protein